MSVSFVIVLLLPEWASPDANALIGSIITSPKSLGSFNPVRFRCVTSVPVVDDKCAKTARDHATGPVVCKTSSLVGERFGRASSCERASFWMPWVTELTMETIKG